MAVGRGTPAAVRGVAEQEEFDRPLVAAQGVANLHRLHRFDQQGPGVVHELHELGVLLHPGQLARGPADGERRGHLPHRGPQELGPVGVVVGVDPQ